MVVMRKDLEALLLPLEAEKHARRRAALKSRHTGLSAGLLIAAVALAYEETRLLGACLIVLVFGLVAIGRTLSRLSRITDPVSTPWLMLAVECRLSCAGREALTPLLLAKTVSGDDALAWARAERERMVDNLREAAVSRELQRH